MTVPQGMQGAGRLVGVVLYVVTGFFYITSGLIVPLFPWLMILNAVWAFGFVVMLRRSRAQWWVAPVGAVAAIVFWVVFVWGGEAIFGWTA